MRKPRLDTIGRKQGLEQQGTVQAVAALVLQRTLRALQDAAIGDKSDMAADPVCDLLGAFAGQDLSERGDIEVLDLQLRPHLIERIGRSRVHAGHPGHFLGVITFALAERSRKRQNDGQANSGDNADPLRCGHKGSRKRSNHR